MQFVLYYWQHHLFEGRECCLEGVKGDRDPGKEQLALGLSTMASSWWQERRTIRGRTRLGPPVCTVEVQDRQQVPSRAGLMMDGSRVKLMWGGGSPVDTGWSD